MEICLVLGIYDFSLVKLQSTNAVEPRLSDHQRDRIQAVALVGWSCWRILLWSITFVAVGLALLNETNDLHK